MGVSNEAQEIHRGHLYPMRVPHDSPAFPGTLPCCKVCSIVCMQRGNSNSEPVFSLVSTKFY